VRAEQRRFRRAREGQVWRAPELPRYYYHDHFERFLGEVDAAHRVFLGPEELDFLARFEALPFNARCAFVRIANRRGYVFDLDKLIYPEIECPESAWSALAASGFTEAVSAPLARDWLERLTRPELVRLLGERLDPARFRKSWKKAELVRVALEEIDPEALAIPDRFVAQGRRDELSYLLYLFFGRIEDNLQVFTLHELGLCERPDAGEGATHRFDSYEEARVAFFYAKAAHDFRHGGDLDALRLIETRGGWPEPLCDESEARRDRLLQQLGGWAERGGTIDQALSIYAASGSPHCNERTVRIRHRRDGEGDREWVRARLEAMIDDPGSDEELLFAEDFYARKFRRKRTSATTDLIRSAATITVDEAYRQQPERGALHHYGGRGVEVYRTENAPWRTLFVLLFWNELFGHELAPRQLPPSLRAGTFHARNASAIEAKLATLDDPSRALEELERAWFRHANTNEDEPDADASLLPWEAGSLDRERALLTHAPSGAVAEMLGRMARDWRATRDGFPDLMLIEDGRVRFVEIKTAGDSLRRNQLARMTQLKAAGFDIDIVRVAYAVDPDQTYVVVDVETTGNRPGLHRITELGAVKVRGEEIVDEFQTLVNPSRRIPPHITRLTGISDEMVAGAPRFTDIADRFEAFVGEAIFVAHNVNFDYGFVSAEFEMIDRVFRRPKLCTCASMRRHYPGHRSYSLKRLCGELGIPLDSHHRALCDARAAAGLLRLINAKRTAT